MYRVYRPNGNSCNTRTNIYNNFKFKCQAASSIICEYGHIYCIYILDIAASTKATDGTQTCSEIYRCTHPQQIRTIYLNFAKRHGIDDIAPEEYINDEVRNQLDRSGLWDDENNDSIGIVTHELHQFDSKHFVSELNEMMAALEAEMKVMETTQTETESDETCVAIELTSKQKDAIFNAFIDVYAENVQEIYLKTGVPRSDIDMKEIKQDLYFDTSIYEDMPPPSNKHDLDEVRMSYESICRQENAQSLQLDTHTIDSLVKNKCQKMKLFSTNKSLKAAIDGKLINHYMFSV